MIRVMASSGSGGQGETRATRIALEQTAGQYVVIAVGLGIVVAGLVLVYMALSRKFREELKEGQMGRSERRWSTAEFPWVSAPRPPWNTAVQEFTNQG